MAKPGREVLLTFEWDGKTVHKEAIGFEGKACAIETAFLEEAFAATDENKTFKREYHHSDNVSATRLRT